MNVTRNKVVMGIALLLVLMIPLIATANADTINATNETAMNKLPVFLHEVIGIDLTKYSITNQGYGVSYPSEFGGIVKEENIIFTLDSRASKIVVAGVFDNGMLSWIHFYPVNGSILYARQPSISALAESRNILERYQTFAAKYQINTSHVSTALSLLSQIPDAPIVKASLSNLNNMSDFVSTNLTSSNMKLMSSQTGIGWSYTENGIDVPNKSIGMDFGDNTFIFSDTWNLYSVGTSTMISKDEAATIAWNAAKNYNFNITNTERNDSTVVKPDWTNKRSEIIVTMVPGQIYNNSLNNAVKFATTGNTTRNPLALYPLWQTVYYFNRPIGDIYGIQVGVWGDTKEIAYCSTYGFLGTSGPMPTAIVQPSAAIEHLEKSAQNSISEQSMLSPTVILAISLATVVSIVIGVIVKKRR